MDKYFITVHGGAKGTARMTCSISSKPVKNHLQTEFTLQKLTLKGFSLEPIIKTKKIPIAVKPMINVDPCAVHEIAIRDYLNIYLKDQVKITIQPFALPGKEKKIVKKGITIRSQIDIDLFQFDDLETPGNFKTLNEPGPGTGTNFPDNDNPVISFDPADENTIITVGEDADAGNIFGNGININQIQDQATKQISIEFDVLYATTRERNDQPKSLNEFYGYGRVNAIEYGLCRVSIPQKRLPGELNRPGWLEKLILGENKKKHFVILAVDPKKESHFINILVEKFNAYERNDVLIFIHGFRNSFADSVRRAAQIGFDLNFQGPVIAFSWPSIGTTPGYITDMDSARDAGRLLKDMLIRISQTHHCGKIHVIAHSMGNVALTEALMALKDAGTYPLPKINQIILAAPDLDQNLFINTIYKKIYFPEMPPRITLYASTKDKALLLAKKIRNDYPRVGSGGEELVILEGIESIDASLVDTGEMLEHSYFAGSPAILYDIRDVLSGRTPKDRVLDPQTRIIAGIKKNFWTFRMAKSY